MRFPGLIAVVSVGVVLGGCSGSGTPVAPGLSTARTTPEAEVATETTKATPTVPEATYVRVPGDPRRHVLQVTIHDVPPLDAYRVEGRRCVSSAVAQQAPHQLVFSGPSRHLEERPIDPSFDIPTTASLLDDGSCEAELRVTVPYRPRYRGGVAIEGKGISLPTDPTNEWVETKGDSQAVVVLE